MPGSLPRHSLCRSSGLFLVLIPQVARKVGTSEVWARCINKRPWLHIPDEMPTIRESSNHLPLGYRLEHDADILVLRRSSDGSFVGAFSARGVTEQAVLRSVEDDRCGRPAYTGPQEHAGSVRRMVETRLGSSWERFLRTERRMLQARKNGQLAKALAGRLPTESREELARMASEDRRRAEEGLVALMSEEAKLFYKHIKELSTE